MTVKVGASGIVVHITPSSAQLHPGETVQFKATVSGTSNQNVVWKVNGASGGSTVVGTISASGLYTAPAVLTPGATTLTITAPSVQDPQSSNTPSNVTLLSPS
jgi:hypothetical protein